MEKETTTRDIFRFSRTSKFPKTFQPKTSVQLCCIAQLKTCIFFNAAIFFSAGMLSVLRPKVDVRHENDVVWPPLLLREAKYWKCWSSCSTVTAVATKHVAPSKHLSGGPSHHHVLTKMLYVLCTQRQIS